MRQYLHARDECISPWGTIIKQYWAPQSGVLMTISYSTVGAIPDSFGTAENLKVFDVKLNSFTSFPSAWTNSSYNAINSSYSNIRASFNNISVSNNTSHKLITQRRSRKDLRDILEVMQCAFKNWQISFMAWCQRRKPKHSHQCQNLAYEAFKSLDNIFAQCLEPQKCALLLASVLTWVRIAVSQGGFPSGLTNAQQLAYLILNENKMT